MRQVKKHTRSMKETLIFYAIGLLLSLYLGILCGGVYIEGCSIGHFLETFNDFIIKQHHFIVGFTAATPTFMLSLSMAWTVMYILHVTKIEHPFAGQEYGSARWGDARSFTKQFANHKNKYFVQVNPGDVKLKKRLWVNTANYWIAEGVYISIFNEKTSNLNILVVGPPGSGKSFRLVRPILSQLCGNFVVTDPKGGAERSVVKSYGTVSAGFQNLIFE